MIQFEKLKLVSNLYEFIPDAGHEGGLSGRIDDVIQEMEEIVFQLEIAFEITEMFVDPKIEDSQYS